MDLETQKRIKEFAETNNKEDLVIIFGAAEDEASGLAAETVIAGDPTFSGALAGVALELAAFHVVEDEIKSAIDPTVYDEQVGMMEMVLDVDAIKAEMNEIRG